VTDLDVQRCIQCTQLLNISMAGVFWALSQDEAIPEIHRGMYSIMCGDHASSVIMKSINFGIKPAKEVCTYAVNPRPRCWSVE